MFKKQVKQQPTFDQAQTYVRKGIYGVGGRTEAWGGFVHKSFPAITGTLSSVSINSVLALFFRILIIAVAALFPLLVRKVTASTPANQVPTSASIGNDLADFLSEHWKGQNVYMNADAQFKLSKRDLEIYRRMERGNAHELAKEFELSYVRVYQIYRRCLAIARSRTQPSLFEAPEMAGPDKLSTDEKVAG